MEQRFDNYMIYFHVHETEGVFYSNTIKQLADFLNSIEYWDYRIETKECSVSIFPNKYESKSSEEIQFPDEYHCFSHYMDFLHEQSETWQIEFINSILNWFWTNNIPAVGEGDSENFIYEGGYNQAQLPWPNNSNKTV